MARIVKVAEEVAGAATEQRIAWLTLLLGFAAAAILALAHQRSWATGLAIGTVLGWLNFRWLKRGLDALVRASEAQQGREKPRVPFATYFTAIFRYGLLALVVYVIFNYLHVPVGSMLVGLCALAAATIAASVWEILHPVD
jgi:small-conductance mechanosensitive channel